MTENQRKNQKLPKNVGPLVIPEYYQEQENKRKALNRMLEMGYPVNLSDDFGFPSADDIFEIKNDVIMSMSSNNQVLHTAQFVEKSVYFPDDFELKVGTQMRRMQNEMRVYQLTVPSKELYQHFKRRTLNMLREKSKLTPNEQVFLGVLENENISSFYDLAIETKAFDENLVSKMLGSLDEGKLKDTARELAVAKLESTFALQYYMKALGTKDLPSLKFQGYGAFKKNTQRLMRSRNEDYIEDYKLDLLGSYAAHEYLFKQMRNTPRWRDVSAYMNWHNLYPKVDELPQSFESAFKKNYGENSFLEETFKHVWDEYQAVDEGIKGISAFAQKIATNGDGFVPYYRTPGLYWSCYGSKDNSDEIARATGASYNVISELATELDVANESVAGLISLPIAVGSLGFTGNIALGVLADRAIYYAGKYTVFNNMLEGDIEEAKEHMVSLTKSVVKEQKNLKEQLKFFDDPSFKKVLEYVYGELESSTVREDEALREYLEAEIQNSDENDFFKKEEFKEKYEEMLSELSSIEGVDEEYKTKARSLQDAQLELERLRQELSVYNYCLNRYRLAHMERERDVNGVLKNDGNEVAVSSQSKTDDSYSADRFSRERILQKQRIKPVSFLKDESPAQTDVVSDLVDKTCAYYMEEFFAGASEIYPINPLSFSGYLNYREVQRRSDFYDKVQRRISFDRREKVLDELKYLFFSNESPDIKKLKLTPRVEENLELLKKSAEIDLEKIEDPKQKEDAEKRVERYEGIDTLKTTYYELLSCVKLYGEGKAFLDEDVFDDIKRNVAFSDSGRKKSLEIERKGGVDDFSTGMIFATDRDIFEDMIRVLATSSQYKKVCQQNGWVNQKGEPDLSKIVPQPKQMGNVAEYEMSLANATQKRFFELLKGFENYRKKENETEKDQENRGVQGGQKGKEIKEQSATVDVAARLEQYAEAHNVSYVPVVKERELS